MLNLRYCYREENWTGFKRKDMGSHYLTQWNDMCFITTESFFRLVPGICMVDAQRWLEDPLLGSGVGKQITERVYNRKFRMYQVKESLATHGYHPSVMNPEARKKEKKMLQRANLLPKNR